MSNIVLQCKDLCKSYDLPNGEKLSILENINLAIERGALIAICGNSGCGKSTFMNIVGLLDRQTSGSFTLDEVEFSTERNNSKLAEIRSRKIGFIFQQHHLLPELTALENVMTAELIRGKSKKEASENATAILKRLFFEEEISRGALCRTPSKLSGGQCQRVAIARALVGNPPLILADEPTGNLDETSSKQVFDLFLKLQKELGISTIMVTHNPLQAQQADIAYRIHDKRLE